MVRVKRIVYSCDCGVMEVINADNFNLAVRTIETPNKVCLHCGMQMRIRIEREMLDEKS